MPGMLTYLTALMRVRERKITLLHFPVPRSFTVALPFALVSLFFYEISSLAYSPDRPRLPSYLSIAASLAFCHTCLVAIGSPRVC